MVRIERMVTRFITSIWIGIRRHQRLSLQHENDESDLRNLIQPMEYCTKFVKKVYVKDSAVDAICHGASLANSGIVKLDENIHQNNIVAIMTLKNELLAIGTSLYSADDIVNLDTQIVIDIQKVFIVPGTYIKMWK